jgi:hypothetical protein
MTEGFAKAMESVGWIIRIGDEITIPNMQRHNGQTAKTRAATGKRVEKHRNLCNADTVTNVTLEPLPEKRREEKRRVLEEDPPNPLRGNCELADIIWEMTPAAGRQRSSKKQLTDALAKTPASIRPTIQTARTAMSAWLACDAWSKNDGEFVPGIHRWVVARQWENLPPPASCRQRGIAENLEIPV